MTSSAGKGDVLAHVADDTPSLALSRANSQVTLVFPDSLLPPYMREQALAESVAVISDAALAGAFRAVLLGLKSANSADDATLARALWSAVDLGIAMVSAELGFSRPESNATDAARLDAIKTHIAFHLSDPNLNLSAVAAANYLSVRHIQRLFAQAGEAPAEWIRSRRIELASRELVDPARRSASIAEIANRVGFKTQSHFGQVFSDAVGMSPGEYRRRMTG